MDGSPRPPGPAATTASSARGLLASDQSLGTHDPPAAEEQAQQPNQKESRGGRLRNPQLDVVNEEGGRRQTVNGVPDREANRVGIGARQENVKVLPTRGPVGEGKAWRAGKFRRVLAQRDGASDAQPREKRGTEEHEDLRSRRAG